MSIREGLPFRPFLFHERWKQLSFCLVSFAGVEVRGARHGSSRSASHLRRSTVHIREISETDLERSHSALDGLEE